MVARSIEAVRLPRLQRWGPHSVARSLGLRFAPTQAIFSGAFSVGMFASISGRCSPGRRHPSIQKRAHQDHIAVVG
jgi:hypothetical protein